jgi:hypothetical protein
MYCDEFVEEDYVINDSIEAMLAKSTGHIGHKRSGSATPLRIIGEVGRIGDKVTSIFGNIASEITGKQVFNPTSAHSVVVEALEKTRSSEALAKRLWMSFVVEGKEALFQEDIEEVLGPARKEEAQASFDALDNDGNGDISLDEMIMKVVEIGRDRKAIAASMRDVGQAIGVLDQVLIAVLFVIVIFIFGMSHSPLSPPFLTNNIQSPSKTPTSSLHSQQPAQPSSPSPSSSQPRPKSSSALASSSSSNTPTTSAIASTSSAQPQNSSSSNKSRSSSQSSNASIP